MIFKLNFFLKELILFGLTLAIGIFVSHSIAPLLSSQDVSSISYTISDLFFFVAMLIIFSLVMTKFKRASSITFNIFLVIVVLAGSQIVFETLTSPLIGFGLAL